MSQTTFRSEWRLETPEEKAEFETWVKSHRPRAAHNMKRRKLLPWLLCARCGLVALKNEATRKAMRDGCQL